MLLRLFAVVCLLCACAWWFLSCSMSWNRALLDVNERTFELPREFHRREDKAEGREYTSRWAVCGVVDALYVARINVEILRLEELVKSFEDFVDSAAATAPVAPTLYEPRDKY